MVDIAGTSVSQYEQEVLSHPAIGGVILFSRNYHDPEQLADLTRCIRCIKSPSLLIAVDQEGGKVQRFQKPFTVLPCLATLAAQFHADSEFGLQLIHDHGTLMAQQVLACGVDFSFSPVLDLANPISSVIGQLGRAFDAAPKTVSLLCEHYILAMKAAGMQAVGKHFPGHGSVVGDTHIGISIDKRNFSEIEQHDLVPFKQLSPMLPGIMMAHVIYEQFDEFPASLSTKWITSYLRNKLKFEGLVFSDALDMQALDKFGDMSERVSLALSSGCDMALICNDTKAVEQVLDKNKFKKNSELLPRIENMRGHFTYDWQALQALPETRLRIERLENIGQ
jgi:beta-N-acetylhexosaminidase